MPGMKQKCVFSKAFQILREEKDFLGSEHFGTEITIDVGGGPSGPSIEGPFCCTVHLCRTLGDRKIEEKSKKREKK